jgi:ferredoxin
VKDDEPHLHYVATRGEAEELVARFDKFWVADCGCREGGPGCRRSRADVCLHFDTQAVGADIDFREVDADFVAGILKEAEEKRLVVRPFRYEQDKTRVQGICFCCDDCCGYFTEAEKYECDKGRFVARIDAEACAACGTCVDVCHFGAREITGGELAFADEKCYGCGLCADVCPEQCVTMAAR